MVAGCEWDDVDRGASMKRTKRTKSGTEVGELHGAAHGPSFDGIRFVVRVFRNGETQTLRIYRRGRSIFEASDWHVKKPVAR